MREPIMLAIGGALFDVLKVLAEFLVPKSGSSRYLVGVPAYVLEPETLKSEKTIVLHTVCVPVQPFKQNLFGPVWERTGTHPIRVCKSIFYYPPILVTMRLVLQRCWESLFQRDSEWFH